MDLGALLTDAFTYAQEALMGKWTRWAIFILFALPFSLIQFVFDPKKIVTGTTINWSAIPWGQIAVLAGLGIILSFFLSGYSVRIYRGVKSAPDFIGWTDLFVDGIKLAIVWFLWILPIFIVLAAIGLIAYATISTATASPNIVLLLLVLLLLLIEFVLIVFVLLFGIIGAVRFARTGSIREGIRVSAILTTIRTMGWLSYILLLIGFIIAAVIYAVITGILSAIPYIGWFLVLIVNPVFMIFTARYFSLVYDQGEPKPVPPITPIPPVAPAAAAE